MTCRRAAVLAVVLALAHAQYQNQYNQNQQQQRYSQQQYQQNGLQNQQYNQNQQYRSGQNSLQSNNARTQNQPNQRMQNQQMMNQYPGQQQGAGMPAQQSGTVVRSNDPIRMDNSTEARAQVSLQLTGYSNPSNSLSATTTCACPTASCTFLEGKPPNQCQMAFTVIVSSADQTVQVIQSDFYPFDKDLRQGNWTHPISLQMPSKPVAVDVIVQHYGISIDRTTVTLKGYNNIFLVDAFAMPLNKIDPSAGTGGQSQTINSRLQPANALQMSFAVQCLGNYMGPNCELTCGSSASNSDLVLCTNTITGIVNSCRYNGIRTQVVNCISCVQVNSTSNTCIDGSHPVGPAGVSHAFRTWTIVLGILLGLALIIIVCLIIAYIICRNRAIEEDDSQAPAVYKNPYPNPPQSANNRAADEWASSPSRRPLIDYDGSRHSDEAYRPSAMMPPPATAANRHEAQV